MTDIPADSPRNERLERAVANLRSWLDHIRRVPTILTCVLYASVVSGLGLAWFWFVSSDHVWIRWLAVPWLALVAAPQLGLWLLTSSLRDLFELPDRLLTIKSGLTEGGERLLERMRSEEERGSRRHGVLRTLREAYALHGEVGKVVATRALVHRFTGPVAVLIGPASFIANCIIVALAVLVLAVST
jgi:hypothetical protein